MRTPHICLEVLKVSVARVTYLLIVPKTTNKYIFQSMSNLEMHSTLQLNKVNLVWTITH
jgi:hypothetical protein